ncbi:MAG: hypothetical protein FJ315_09255, partial [SAR202 cluster bacterium]|nr:hypothetical protein [SAR202 cluster bacterium]
MAEPDETRRRAARGKAVRSAVLGGAAALFALHVGRQMMQDAGRIQRVATAEPLDRRMERERNADTRPGDPGAASEKVPLSARAIPHPPGRRPGEQRTNPVDGAVMVWVPPGEFPMGDNQHRSDTAPVRTVRITRGFWLYRTELTNAMYGKFVA